MHTIGIQVFCNLRFCDFACLQCHPFPKPGPFHFIGLHSAALNHGIEVLIPCTRLSCVHGALLDLAGQFAVEGRVIFGYREHYISISFVQSLCQLLNGCIACAFVLLVVLNEWHAVLGQRILDILLSVFRDHGTTELAKFHRALRLCLEIVCRRIAQGCNGLFRKIDRCPVNIFETGTAQGLANG